MKTKQTVKPRNIKRLTIDLPDELHRKIKAICALKGVKIADEVRKLLVQHFSNK